MFTKSKFKDFVKLFIENQYWRTVLNTVLLLFTFTATQITAAFAHEGSGGPKDPFVGTSPSFKTVAPEPTKFNVGDWGVAEQRGAATYSYSIDVPPGRKGMEPSLILRYSSQSPLRGGLAVGWTMEGLPSIQIDRSLGQEEKNVYKAALGSAVGRLIEVPDSSPYKGKTYRVDYDGSFTRFIHLEPEEFDPGPRGWIALTSDGVKHFFEESELPSTFHESRWHITKQVDRFGNTVRYYWNPVRAKYADERRITTIVDISLDRIEYTSNEPAGLAAHAMVQFIYAPLEKATGSNIPIGALLFNNRGGPVHGYYKGALRLTDIETYVRDEPGAKWRFSKRVSLGYDMDALTNEKNGAPLRFLTKINVTARDLQGNDLSLPPITLDYGRRIRDMSSERIIESPGYGHYGTSQGAIGTLMDLDGDGIRDRVSVSVVNGLCTLTWWKGRFGGFYEVPKEWKLPTTRWANGTNPDGFERCNINGQVVKRNSTKAIISYHFLDVNADGRVDLLTNIWTNGQHNSFLPQPQTLRMAIDPRGPASHIDPFGMIFAPPGGSMGLSSGNAT